MTDDIREVLTDHIIWIGVKKLGLEYSLMSSGDTAYRFRHIRFEIAKAYICKIEISSQDNTIVIQHQATIRRFSIEDPNCFQHLENQIRQATASAIRKSAALANLTSMAQSQ